MTKLVKKSTGSTNKVKHHSQIVGKGNKTIHEEGTSIEQETKITPNNGRVLVGLCKGVTINLGGYQSARIDCWITSECSNSARAKQDALAADSLLIDEQLDYESERIRDIAEQLK